MSGMERLLRSSRPELCPCVEHRDDLRRRLLQRENGDAIAGFLARRPEFAVLALSASVAFVLWVLSLTTGALSPLPRRFDAPALEHSGVIISQIAAPPRIGLGAYAAMLIPRTQTLDIAGLHQALAQTMDVRKSARRIVEDE